MYAQFDRFEIKMTKVQAQSVSHQGRCDEDVQILLEDKAIIRQLKKIGDEKIATELKEYGAWDETELLDTVANHERIIWIAGCNIIEELAERGRK